MVDFPEMRQAMVERQMLPESIVASRVIGALLDIPREYFVPRQQQHIAYMDDTFPLSYNRFLLRPVVFAKMLQALDPQPHEKALIIGCNLGYSMAVMSQLIHAVVGVEEVEVLSKEAEKALERIGVKNFEVILGQHKKGFPDSGPYDVIFIEGRIQGDLDILFDQLKDGGRLVVITSCPMRADEVTLYSKIKGQISKASVCEGNAPVLKGFEPKSEFEF